MKQSWKVALAYTAFNFAVLGIIALFAWASPDRELSDYDFAYGMFVGASIYPMTRVIDGTINRHRTTNEEEA